MKKRKAGVQGVTGEPCTITTQQAQQLAESLFWFCIRRSFWIADFRYGSLLTNDQLKALAAEWANGSWTFLEFVKNGFYPRKQP